MLSLVFSFSFAECFYWLSTTSIGHSFCHCDLLSSVRN